MSRSLTATVSTAALAHNLSVARRHAGDARIWAVVKADAYGHGLEAAVSGLAATDGFALLEWPGAQRLRTLGWQGPILMLEGAFGRDDYAIAEALGLTVVVHCPEQIDWLADYRSGPSTRSAGRDGPGLELVVKVESGMGRLGFPPSAVDRQVARLRALPGIVRIGWMTHFANAERDGGTAAPIAVFSATLAGAAREREPRSLANSAALIGQRVADADWARPGIMLYGASPFEDRTARALGLQPAMRLAGSLIAVRHLAVGDCYGYGSTFVAEHPIRIGIVDCGYADGYPRLAPTGTPVAVDGIATRTIGRVSMDMLAVDLTPIPAAGVGTPVELWGATVPVDSVAAAAGTIGYELLCAVAPRVTRAVTSALLDGGATGKGA